MRHPDVINARNEIARMTLRVVCEGCQGVIFQKSQKEVNGAPSTAKALMGQATRKHAAVCEKWDGQARIERGTRSESNEKLT